MRGDLEYYDPDICDGDFCPLNCEHCPKADLVIQKEAQNREEEARSGSED